MKRLLQEILDALKLEDIVIDSDRKETEEEAREYFGDEFIRKFEEIKKACVEGETALVIHGTDIESAEQIQREGLFAQRNDLSSTAIGCTYLDEYSELLNWPHKYLKGLVMIGEPLECSDACIDGQQKGIFEYVEDDSKSEYSLEYRIRPEFIIGYIDVENKQIYENESYSNKHDYTGLIVDRDIGFKAIGISDTISEQFEVSEDESRLESDISQPKPYTPPKEMPENRIRNILSGVTYDLANIRNNYREGVLQEEWNNLTYGINYYMSLIDELIQEWDQLLPTDEDWGDYDWDDEIIDAISDIPTHEVNDMTGELVQQPIIIEDEQENDWYDPEDEWIEPE